MMGHLCVFVLAGKLRTFASSRWGGEGRRYWGSLSTAGRANPWSRWAASHTWGISKGLLPGMVTPVQRAVRDMDDDT